MLFVQYSRFLDLTSRGVKTEAPGSLVSLESRQVVLIAYFRCATQQTLVRWDFIRYQLCFSIRLCQVPEPETIKCFINCLEAAELDWAKLNLKHDFDRVCPPMIHIAIERTIVLRLDDVDQSCAHSYF